MSVALWGNEERILNMTEETKAIVDRTLVHIMEIKEGTEILMEGEVNLDMYKILTGHAEIYIGYGTEKETLIGIIGPQACFGEFGLLLSKPALYTVIAYSDMTIFRITEGEMGDFVQNNHRNIINIMRNMAQTMLIMRAQIDMLLDDIDNGRKPDQAIVHALEKNIGCYAAGQKPREPESGRMRAIDMRRK